MTQEGGGDNVIEFQTCAGTSVTLTDTSSLVDGHSYVLLLKVRLETNHTHSDCFYFLSRTSTSCQTHIYVVLCITLFLFYFIFYCLCKYLQMANKFTTVCKSIFSPRA